MLDFITKFGSCQTEFGSCQTEFGSCQTEFGSFQTQFGSFQTQFVSLPTAKLSLAAAKLSLAAAKLTNLGEYRWAMYRTRPGPGPPWAPKRNVVLNQMGHLVQKCQQREDEEVDPRATSLDLTHASHQSLVLAPLLHLAPTLPSLLVALQ